MNEDEVEEGTILTSFGVILIWLAILLPLWNIAFALDFYIYKALAAQPNQSVIELVPEAKPASPNGARG